MRYSILLLAVLFHAPAAEARSRLSGDAYRERGLPAYTEIPSDLRAATNQLLAFLRSEQFTPDQCEPVFSGIREKISQLQAAHFNRKQAINDAETILRNLWTAKLEVRRKLGEFLENGDLDEDCVVASRDLFRVLRFVEGYVGYLKLRPPPAPKDDKLQRKPFTGGFPYLVTKPGFENLQFRTGDVFLSRGMAFTSAAIARIGDVNGQFSHLAILYIDPKDGKHYMVESHIEVGAEVATFDTYKSDGKGRVVVFRHPDAELAAQAAKRIHDLVRKHQSTGKNINYDFAMDMNDHGELFCTEIVQYGFEMAAKDLGRGPRLPLFPTRIGLRNTDFLDAIGVKNRKIFAPADMEVDPRFELLAEWRDYSRIPLIHHHDAILDKEYEWMDEHDYTFFTDFKTTVLRDLVFAARRVPVFSSLLKKRLPLNMRKSALGAVGNLVAASDSLFDYLEAEDRAMLKKTGLMMTHQDMLRALERFRKADLEKFHVYRRWIEFDRLNGEAPAPENATLHWYLRARNLK